MRMENLRTMTFDHTPNGMCYTSLGEPSTHSAPTLFLFTVRVEETLQSEDFSQIARLFLPRGVLCVSARLAVSRNRRACE